MSVHDHLHNKLVQQLFSKISRYKSATHIKHCGSMDETLHLPQAVQAMYSVASLLRCGLKGINNSKQRGSV
jgi:hypothetical protein